LKSGFSDRLKFRFPRRAPTFWGFGANFFQESSPLNPSSLNIETFDLLAQILKIIEFAESFLKTLAFLLDIL